MKCFVLMPRFKAEQEKNEEEKQGIYSEGYNEEI